MPLNLAKEVVALQRMTGRQLRDKYAELFGDATRAKNRPWLIRRIAWRLQALDEGDLSERARVRAAELANDADLRVAPPKSAMPSTLAEPPAPSDVVARNDPRLPPAGAILVRAYKGRMLHVKVLADGFEFEGEVYKTLSAVAKAVTGTHTNGFLFFRLGQYGGEA